MKANAQWLGHAAADGITVSAYQTYAKDDAYSVAYGNPEGYTIL